MIKKAGMALLYGAIAVLIYIYGDAILNWFRGADNLALVAVMATLMALFPIIPYPVIGGLIGAALGSSLGAAITWTGSSAASILMFLFIRYGYQEWAQRILQRYKSVGKVTGLFERNAFLAILFARMLPFIPSIIINVYAALSRVPVGLYAVASTIGKIPAMLLFAFVGDSIVNQPGHIGLVLLGYGLFLLIAAGAYRLWQRRGRTR